MVFLGLQSQRFLKLVLNFILASHELFNLTLHHQGLTLSLLFQLLYFVVLIVSAGFLRDCMVSLSSDSKLAQQVLLCGLCVFQLLPFSQDIVTVERLYPMEVPLLDLVNVKAAIITASK